MGERVRGRASGRIAAPPARRHKQAMRLRALFRDPVLWRRRLSLATGIGLLLGLIGPFGSYLNDNAPARMAYWTGMTWAGTVIHSLAVAAALDLAERRRLPRALAVAGGVILASAPLAALSALAGHLVWPRYTGDLTPLDWYGQTLLPSAVLVAGLLWLEARRAPPAASAQAPGDLPARLRDRVLCLQIEDHYVRVHTAQGSELVLMSLRQAIAAMAGVEGLQTHRSWWVARSAVAEARETARAASLVLTNGVIAPVARNRIAQLRAAGWLRA